MAKQLEIKLIIVPGIDESRLNATFALIEKALGEARDTPLISPKALTSLDRASKEIGDVQKELAEAGLAGVKAFDKIGVEVDQVAQKGSKLGTALGKAFVANQAVEFAQKAADSLNEVINVGAEFEASLAAVGAITGQSGEALDKLGERGRELALVFGGPATSQLESFQGILSKFGAQVADSPAALGKLATNINILSAASGDDAKTSMGAVTDAMLQFGLVTGDANKDAETSTRIINGLAASAQVGAAEIPQVAEAILQAGVAAKGANLSFESTNAALQVLAIGGKTGSEAGVGLRNVLGLIQKASGPAEIAMSKLGTSSKELGELLTTKGLDAALAKIKGGMDNLGTAAERNSTLMEIFGTENSAAAGILLDNVDKFKEFEEGIIAGQQGVGAAFEQAAVRMNTSKTGIAQAKAFIEDQFISIFQTFGSGLSTTLGATAQIAPMVVTLSGLKDVFPVERAGAFAKTLLTETIPGLYKSVAGFIASAGAKAAEAVATGGATIAQTALNAVMSANPVFLLVTGIGLLVGAYLLFSSSTKDLKEATDDANASLTKLQEATAQEAAVKKNSESIDKLAGNYKRLQLSAALITASGGDASATQRELAATASELAERVPSAADAIGDLKGKFDENGPSVAINVAELKRFNEEQEKIAAQNAADALADFDDQNKSLFESLDANIEKIAELREERTRLAAGDNTQEKAFDIGLAVLGGPIAQGLQFVGIIDTADDALENVREKANKISPEIEKARVQLKESTSEYARQGFTIDDIAEKLGKTKEQLDGFVTPDFKNSLVNSEALKSSIEDMGGAQQQVVNKVINQTEALQNAQAKAAELKESIENALAIGDTDTAEKLKKDLAGVQEEIAKDEITLKTTLDSEDAKEALKALPDEAKAILKPVTATVDMVVSEQSLKDTAQAGGKLIREIGELQKQRDAATSESQKALLDEKINAKTVELTNNIGKQGEAIAANTDRLQELRAAKERASDPKEVARLTGEITALEKKTNDASVRLADTAKSSQKVGATKGDINQLAGAYGSASTAGRGIDIAMKNAASSTKEVGEAVKDVGAEFEEAQKKANDIVNTLASQYAANLLRLKGDLDDVTRQKLLEQQRAIEEQARRVNADIRAGKSALDESRQALGFNVEADDKAAREQARKAREERRKALAETIKHQAELRAIRQKAAAEEIEDELAKKLRDIQITVDKARSQQRADIVLAGDDKAAITAANRAFENATETARLARNAAVEEAKKQYGIEVLRIQNDLAAQQIEIIRDQAAEITETDVRSVQERSDAVLAAMALDGQAQINKKIEESEKFKKIATELGERASSDEIAARLRVAAAQEAIDNKTEELIAAREKLRAEARKKKNATIPAELTVEEIRKAIGEAGLTKVLEDAQKDVDVAHTVLVNKMLALRTDVLVALRLKPEERTQAQRDLLASMNLTEAEMTQLLASLENITRDNARATAALVLKAEEELKTAQLEARLSTITDVAERERLQSEIEARKTLQAELAALDRAAIAVDVRRKELADQRAAAGETGLVGPTLDDVAIQSEQDKVDKARLAAHARFRALQRKNELDGLKESNILIAGGLEAQLAIYKTFYGELDQARRDDLQKQKDALAVAGEDLISQLQNDKINLDQFFTERAKNRDDQAKLDAELGGVNDDFWDGFSRAGETAFKALAVGRSKVLDSSLVTLNTAFGDQLDNVAKEGKVAAFSLDEIGTAAEKAAEEATGVIAATWGQMAASGRATLGDFADAAIVTSLKSIRTIIEGNIIGIISAAFAINPFVGIAAIPAIFLVEALLAKWESDAQSRLGAHGFAGGGLVQGPKQLIWVNDDPGQNPEFVMSGGPTSRYTPEFEAINKGVDPYTVFGSDEKWESLFIDIEGRLQQGYEKINALESQVVDIKGALKPGSDMATFYHTEAILIHEAQKETTAAVRELTAAMREEFEKQNEEIKKGNFERERNTKESRATNELIGKDGYGNSSLATQLAELTKKVDELARQRGRW